MRRTAEEQREFAEEARAERQAIENELADATSETDTAESANPIEPSVEDLREELEAAKQIEAARYEEVICYSGDLRDFLAVLAALAGDWGGRGDDYLFDVATVEAVIQRRRQELEHAGV